MRERRALRFAVEALFLAALAAALTVADVSAPAIAGLMLLGWLVVALYEWAATRELPHYGRGLPPRYYVPQVSLPPPRPLEQRPSGYPAADVFDEEPTWIASPAMRDEMLAEWPIAAGAPAPAGEDTVVDGLLFAAIAEELREDAALDDEAAPAANAREAAPAPDPPGAAVPEPEEEPLPAAVVVPELEARPEAEALPGPAAPAEHEAPGEPVPVDEGAPRQEVQQAAVAGGPDRHRFDPLTRERPRRRWRKRPDDEVAVAEIPARPPVPAGLPGHSRREH